MINVLQNFRNYLGMDANYFFPVVVTLLSMLISTIIQICGMFRNGKQNRLLKLHVKDESQLFYCKVLGLDMAIIIVESIIYILFIIIFQLLFKNTDSLIYKKIIVAVFTLVFYLISFKIVTKRVFIRERIIGDKVGKWLIYIPLVVIHIYFYLSWSYISNQYFNIVINISIIIFETVGMLHFHSRYIKYKYSSVCIYTVNNKVIDCKDITKIFKEHDAVVIMNGGIENRIKYDSIARVKYYGESKVILKNGWFI